VTIDVELERRARWQGAADHLGLSLEEWISRVADEAAAAVAVAA
jgi:hypothetical protein